MLAFPLSKKSGNKLENIKRQKSHKNQLLMIYLQYCYYKIKKAFLYLLHVNILSINEFNEQIVDFKMNYYQIIFIINLYYIVDCFCL